MKYWNPLFFGLLCIPLSLLSNNAQEPSISIMLEADQQSPSCFGGEDGMILLTIIDGTAPYQIIWSQDTTELGNEVTNNAEFAIGSLSAGTYLLTVIDSVGSQDSLEVMLTEPDEFSIEAFFDEGYCFRDTQISLNLTFSGGNYPINYSVGNEAYSVEQGDATVIVPVPGMYEILASDSSGCLAQLPTPLEILPQEVSIDISLMEDTTRICFGDSLTGVEASIEGDQNGLYSLFLNDVSQNDFLLDNLGPGNYEVYARSSTGCSSDTLSFVIEQFEELIVEASSPNEVICFGDSSGTIVSNIVGGDGVDATFFISAENFDDFNASGIFEGLPAQTYSIRAENGLGCVSEEVGFTIRQYDELEIDVTADSVEEPSCFAGADGAFEVAVSGGSGQGYVFNVNGVDYDTSLVEGVSAGMFSIVASDDASCISNTLVFSLGQPDSLFAVSAITNVSCDGSVLGSILLEPAGGAGEYSVSWEDGSEGLVRDELPAGNYGYTLTDNNGCEFNSVAIVLDSLGLTSEVIPISCNGGSDGRVQLAVEGGNGTINFIWNDGSEDSFLGGLGVGEYSVTVTDSEDCLIQASFLLAEPDPISVNLVDKGNPCENLENGFIEILASGGRVPYTFQWDNNEAGNLIEDLVAGDYTVTVTDSNGCTVSEAFALQNLEVPAIDIEIASGKLPYLVTGFASEPLVLRVVGVPDGAVVTWLPEGAFNDPLAQTVTAFPVDTITYFVDVATTEGCTAQASLKIETEQEFEILLPSAFSPNANGENDLFRPIYNMSLIEIRSMVVLNRWGKVVFEANDGSGWDGTFKGKEQPAGSYLYRVEYLNIASNEAGQVVGQVTLIR